MILRIFLFIGFFSASLQAQQLQVKSSPNDDFSKWISFETASLKGKLKVSASTITIKLKNTSESSIHFNGKSALKDLSGRGNQLCAPAQVIPPHKTITLKLTNCNSSDYPNEGLFQLNSSYPSKAAFKEATFFLRNKKYTLSGLGDGGEISFYLGL